VTDFHIVTEDLVYKLAVKQCKTSQLLHFAQGVDITFKEAPGVVRASLLIGCDGANSAVRRACLGPEACAPEPTGGILYRGVLPVPEEFQEQYNKQNISNYVGRGDMNR
jgi:2-polyprenyl-6-methoxyphenol hydroxylase-like FAD-dependent oxidoreductase